MSNIMYFLYMNNVINKISHNDEFRREMKTYHNRQVVNLVRAGD